MTYGQVPGAWETLFTTHVRESAAYEGEENWLMIVIIWQCGDNIVRCIISQRRT